MKSSITHWPSLTLRGFTLIVICVVVTHVEHALAQESSGMWVGFQGGMQLVHPTITDPGVYERPASPPGFGWNMSASGWFDLKKPFALSASIGFSNEPVRAEGETSGGSLIPVPSFPYVAREALRWAELSTSFYYKLIQKEKYAVLAGAGIAVRTLISTETEFTVDGSSSSTNFYADEYMRNWNYALPLSAGASFPVGGNQSIILLAGYQVGLRGIYEPISDSQGNNAWENGFYRVNTTTLRLIYVFNIASKG